MLRFNENHNPPLRAEPSHSSHPLDLHRLDNPSNEPPLSRGSWESPLPRAKVNGMSTQDEARDGPNSAFPLGIVRV